MGLLNILKRKKSSADSEHIRQMEREYHEREKKRKMDERKRFLEKRKKVLEKRERIKKVVFENYYRRHHRTWENHQFKPKTKRSRSRPRDYDFSVFGMPQPGKYEQPFNPFDSLDIGAGKHKKTKR